MTSTVLNRSPSNPVKKKINTDVNVHFPQVSFGFVTSRVSMSTNHGIMVPNGTINCDFTGKISAVLHNHRKINFSIKEGMRIAQLLILQISTPTLHTIQSKRVNSRVECVFGSTDKAFHTDIAPSAPLILTLFPPTKPSPELHTTYVFPTEAPAPTTSHSKKSISRIKFQLSSPKFHNHLTHHIPRTISNIHYICQAVYTTIIITTISST